MDLLNLDKLLARVEKPTRYTGGELNMTQKTDAEYRFALCFRMCTKSGCPIWAPVSFIIS